jgi:hypothetical protein
MAPPLLPLAAAVLALAILTFPARADALGPVDIEVGARAGFATTSDGPLGFGIGGRGGVAFQSFYAGVDVIDYLGATSTCGGCSWPAGAPPVMQSRRALLYGFEAGYNIKLSIVTIRPQLGFGNFRLSSWYGSPSASAISNYVYVGPEVVGLVSIGVLFVGADVGALLMPTWPNSALTAHGQIGVAF